MSSTGSMPARSGRATATAKARREARVALQVRGVHRLEERAELLIQRSDQVEIASAPRPMPAARTRRSRGRRPAPNRCLEGARGTEARRMPSRAPQPLRTGLRATRSDGRGRRCVMLRSAGPGPTRSRGRGRHRSAGRPAPLDPAQRFRQHLGLPIERAISRGTARSAPRRRSSAAARARRRPSSAGRPAPRPAGRGSSGAMRAASRSR